MTPMNTEQTSLSPARDELPVQDFHGLADMSTQDTLKDMKVSMLKEGTQDTTLPPPPGQERAAFEAFCFERGLMSASHGLVSVSSHCDTAWLAWQARAAIAAQAQQSGFSPMWFAPIDGTPVMLYMPTTTNKFAVGQWHGSHDSIIGNWGDDEGNYFTHTPVSFMALSNLERIANPQAAVKESLTPQQAQQATDAGHEAATGILSALVDEAQKILAGLHRYAVDLQEHTLGGRSERGEVPIMDLAEDWLAARPDLEPEQAQQAQGVPADDASRVAVLLDSVIRQYPFKRGTKPYEELHLARRIVVGYTLNGDPPLAAPQAEPPRRRTRKCRHGEIAWESFWVFGIDGGT